MVSESVGPCPKSLKVLQFQLQGMSEVLIVSSVSSLSIVSCVSSVSSISSVSSASRVSSV